MKKNLLFLFGGASPEYFVACSYASSVLPCISKEKYNVYCVGITKGGAWYLTEASTDEIADGETWIQHSGNKRAMLSPDRERSGLYVFDGDGYELLPVDLVFPFLIGETGEDGAIQGLLQIADIPWVGSDVCASACGMDKGVSNIFAAACGCNLPEYYLVTSGDFFHRPEETAAEICSYFAEKLGEDFYPLFVKPTTTGSSIGISRVVNEEELMEALKTAAPYSKRIIIEQGIKGREIKVAIMGNEKPETGACCEVVVKNGVYNTFEMKYKSDGMHKQIPAAISKATEERVKKHAVEVYKKLGCSGFARVDFFLTDDDEVIFNEINTVPGFSEHSIFTHMFEAVGYSYAEIVDKLIETANK